MRNSLARPREIPFLRYLDHEGVPVHGAIRGRRGGSRVVPPIPVGSSPARRGSRDPWRCRSRRGLHRVLGHEPSVRSGPDPVTDPLHLRELVRGDEDRPLPRGSRIRCGPAPADPDRIEARDRISRGEGDQGRAGSARVMLSFSSMPRTNSRSASRHRPSTFSTAYRPAGRKIRKSSTNRRYSSADIRPSPGACPAQRGPQRNAWAFPGVARSPRRMSPEIAGDAGKPSSWKCCHAVKPGTIMISAGNAPVDLPVDGGEAAVALAGFFVWITARLPARAR